MATESITKVQYLRYFDVERSSEGQADTASAAEQVRKFEQEPFTGLCTRSKRAHGGSTKFSTG